MLKYSVAVLATFLLSGLSLFAADWPQWRGPDRTGLSKETGLLKTWPEKGPPLLWSISNIGLGYSSPAIVGDRLYILGTRTASEYAFALDTKDGKEIWSSELGPIFKWQGNTWGDGPRSTPTVDGDRLYALGAQGELACLETETGKKIWGHNLYKEFNGYVMDNNCPVTIGWGYCEGPLVEGDQVVCTPGGDDGLLLALDKKTGKVLWRSKEVKSKAPYSSILVAEVGGIRQYIQLTENGVVGVAATDGKLLWTYAKPNDDLVIRTPIFHNNYVFTTYSFGAGSDLFQLIVDGPAIKAEKVYSNKNIKNEMGGVVLVDEHLYGSSRDNWVCQEFVKKKGDIAWETKRRLGSGSVTYADGQLYCFLDGNGTVLLVEASPKGYKENGRFKIPQESKQRAPSGKIWSHPVVANGRLYLRDQELLFCYNIKQ
ncbi:MAG TPA: PQQ-binding-like beta-propeller repeat protein [Gemmataceae bacterium]|nr:PQQ-binding-like beta-propeller repeat protein [Gemmataceae bacterium]